MRGFLTTLVLFLILLSLGACQLATLDDKLDRMGKATDAVQLGAAAVSGAANLVAAKAAELKQADTNRDGKLSLSEIMAWLAAAGAGVGGLATASASANKQKQIDQLYDATHAPIVGQAIPRAV